MLTTTGYNPTRTINYLFIDGAYLEKSSNKVISSLFDTDEFQIDYTKIGRDYTKTFYYNALPGRIKDESLDSYEKRVKQKEDFYNELKLIPSFHVYEGVTYGNGKKIRQKAVDIMITVDMLRHTIRKNMDRATLIAGDLDFKPLLDALLMEGMFTELRYFSDSFNSELLYASDISIPLSLHNIYNWATDKFQLAFKLPKITNKSDEVNEFRIVGEILVNQNTTPIFKDFSDQYIIEIPRSDNRVDSYVHQNKEFLIRYLNTVEHLEIGE